MTTRGGVKFLSSEVREAPVLPLLLLLFLARPNHSLMHSGGHDDTRGKKGLSRTFLDILASCP